MDGKSSASLLAECSSSPDVNTRKALANALAAAPSMWTLGNAVSLPGLSMWNTRRRLRKRFIANMDQLLSRKLLRSFKRMEFSEVASLDPINLKWKIRVKLLRKFVEVNSVDGSVQLIMVDDKGDRIQSTLRGEYIPKFAKKLLKGRWFVLEGFDLIPANTSFKFSDHPFHINFNPSTTVNKVKSLNSCQYLFAEFRRHQQWPA